MKVVFVQSGLTAGGTEKIVSLLARHRADISDDVHVLAFSGTRESSYFHYDDDITVSTLRNSSGNGGNPILRVATRTIWLRQKFRLISAGRDCVISDEDKRARAYRKPGSGYTSGDFRAE